MIHVSAGGVIVGKNGKVVVVSQGGRSWSLPKGHLDEGEEILVAAKREIREECGISDLNLIADLGSYERPRIMDSLEMKTIHMFLFTTNQLDLQPEDSSNPEARWVDVDEVEELLTAPKDKEFFVSVKSKVLEIKDLILAS